MRDKIGVIQNKSSLLSLIGYIGQLSDDYYQLLMKHADYQFDKMDQPITMFENNRMILIEGYKNDDATRYYIRFIKAEDNNWKLVIGERRTTTDQTSNQAFVYFLENGSLRRDTVQTLKQGNSQPINQITSCVFTDNHFEVIEVDSNQGLVRGR